MSLVENIKSVAKTVQQIDNVGLYRKIIDVQTEIMKFLDEKKKMKEEIELLQKKLEMKGNLKIDRQCYWLDDGGHINGPFCTRCLDVDSKYVRMFTNDKQYYRCPNLSCKLVVEVYPENKMSSNFNLASRRISISDYF